MKKFKGFAKQMMSYLLVIAMCLPNMTPIVSYASDYVQSRPRYVNFSRPRALMLSDVDLSDGLGTDQAAAQEAA